MAETVTRLPAQLQGIARFKFHEGKREEFKRLSAQALEIVRTKDTGTLSTADRRRPPCNAPTAVLPPVVGAGPARRRVLRSTATRVPRRLELRHLRLLQSVASS